MTMEEKRLGEIMPLQDSGSNRRTFLQQAATAAAVGAGTLLPLGLPFANASTGGHDDHDDDSDDLRRRDRDILIAAEIAEALAVTTYTNIIEGSVFHSSARR